MKYSSSPYEDIIHLSRPPSSHPKMSREARAAQFAPFAALFGPQGNGRRKRACDRTQKNVD